MSIIPKLTLYPLYPGGPVVRNTGGINQNTSFYTPATPYTPSFAVNMPPAADATQDNYFFRTSASGQLERVPISQAQNYSGSLAFAPNSTGSIQTATPPAEAPQSPAKYQDFLRSLAVSDYNYDTLMAQASFRLPNIGLGLKVTTDGAGNVDTIALDPSSEGIRGRLSTSSPFFNLANRAEITHRATLRSANEIPAPARPATQPNRGLDPNGLAQGPDAPLNSSVLGLTGPTAGNPFRTAGIANPILERLYRLQPPDNGLAVAGPQSEIGVDQARQIAASQAKLDVDLSAGFRESLAGLKQAAIEQGAIYARSKIAQDKALEAMLPRTQALLPAPTRNAMDAGLRQLGANITQQGAADLGDVTSKKGSGGYIPFQMVFAGSGGESLLGQGGEGSFQQFFGAQTGGGSLAGGDSQQQQQPQPRRQRLMFSA